MKDIHYYDVIRGSLFYLFYTPEMINALNYEDGFKEKLTGSSRGIWEFTTALRRQHRVNGEPMYRESGKHTKIDLIIDQYRDLQNELGINITV